jgi:uncharacterized protein with GYD domain
MRNYLLRVSYSSEGTAGILTEGGTSRRRTIDRLVAGLGATIAAWYYAFGDDDLIIIVKAPGDVEVAALNLRVIASGAAKVHTTVLLTAEQIDEAAKKDVDYHPPGAMS